MTLATFPKATVDQILRLSAQQKSAAEIAHALQLHRMEVLAVIAHQRLSPGAQFPEGQEKPEPLLSREALRSGDSQPSLNDRSKGSPSVELTSTEDEVPSGVYVGEDIEFSTPLTWDPSDSASVQNPHLMIMGESGSGKTYATQGLVAELAQAKIPCIVFDYGQSFELETLDKSFVDYCAPKEHLVGELGLALNPLEISPKDIKGPNQVATRLADVFDSAFQLGDIQKKVFIDAAIRVYEKAGIKAADAKTWTKTAPNMAAFQQAIEELSSDKSYPSYKNAAGLSARLTTFFMLAAFRSEKWSWDALINHKQTRVHILQFRGLEGKTQRVLVEMLLWHLFFHLKSHGQNVLRVFCVLDEAHHLSFRETGPINALLREARKFGLGIIFASQQPEDFSPVAYSNSASKLIFQTSDPNLKVSKFLAGKADNFDKPEDIRDTIAGLARGRALLITRNRGRVVQIADFPKRSTLWSRV